MKRSLLLTVMVAVMSCRMTPSPPPVPVQGSDEDVVALAGDWSGRYWSEATGRRGTIQFSLAEHADTGYGEVQITFSPSLSLSRQAATIEVPKDHPEELPPAPCTTIGITVVRVEDDRVRGTIAPYWDPDCDCRARTVFEGKVSGDRITGTFSTRRESSDRRILTGEWRAERKRA